MIQPQISDPRPELAPAPRPLAALGSFRDEHRDAMSLAAKQAAFDLHVFGAADEVIGWLSKNEAHAILVDTTVKGAEQVCLEARAEAALSQVPILAVARDVSDLTFAEVFGWGGDDVVALGSVRSLTARLRALPAERPPCPSMGRGRALIAEEDRQSRIVLGRVLRNAGYSVTFAVSARDASVYAAAQNVDLVIANASLGSPAEMVSRARSDGSDATWIFRTRPRDLRSQRETLATVERAVVTDGYAPPENVLFLANELARQQGTDQRTSARVLYGATVGFRGAGRECDERGFTYNVSGGGLYVRTLAPPEDDSVWLELVPPRSDRRVRLEGRVAWRRRFGPNERATVPNGFGVQIVDGASADLTAWQDGYRAFAEDYG